MSTAATLANDLRMLAMLVEGVALVRDPATRERINTALAPCVTADAIDRAPPMHQLAATLLEIAPEWEASGDHDGVTAGGTLRVLAATASFHGPVCTRHPGAVATLRALVGAPHCDHDDVRAALRDAIAADVDAAPYIPRALDYVEAVRWLAPEVAQFQCAASLVFAYVGAT